MEGQERKTFFYEFLILSLWGTTFHGLDPDTLLTGATSQNIPFSFLSPRPAFSILVLNFSNLSSARQITGEKHARHWGLAGERGEVQSRGSRQGSEKPNLLTSAGEGKDAFPQPWLSAWLSPQGDRAPSPPPLLHLPKSSK